MTRCQMIENCDSPITHIDRKGYIYCKLHGVQRKSHVNCRKLTAKEIKTLRERGQND